MRLVRRVLADMRSSDWSFYGVTYASILGSMILTGTTAMYLIGPPEDAAKVRAEHRRRT